MDALRTTLTLPYDITALVSALQSQGRVGRTQARNLNRELFSNGLAIERGRSAPSTPAKNIRRTARQRATEERPGWGTGTQQSALRGLMLPSQQRAPRLACKVRFEPPKAQPRKAAGRKAPPAAAYHVPAKPPQSRPRPLRMPAREDAGSEAARYLAMPVQPSRKAGTSQAGRKKAPKRTLHSKPKTAARLSGLSRARMWDSSLFSDGALNMYSCLSSWRALHYPQPT